MTRKLGLILLVLVIGLLLAFFAYKALGDDHSSGFVDEFKDSGEKIVDTAHAVRDFVSEDSSDSKEKEIKEKEEN
ncbi:MAG: hypothetical protein KAT43_03895 [Nanoarchaeota archaeon]|nr:hypothetical protein [Nanoarchaeota archaeon]